MPRESELIRNIQEGLVREGLLTGEKAADGILGPKTLSAMKRSSVVVPAATAKVKEVVAALPERPVSSGNWLSVREVKDTISAAIFAVRGSNARGLRVLESLVAPQSIESVVFEFVKLEAAQSSGRFNAESISPSGLHYGLAQIGYPAWTDAIDKGMVSLPYAQAARTPAGTTFTEEFRTVVFDPVNNIVAAIGFMIANVGYLSAKVTANGWSMPTVDVNLLYAMHNQGHTVIGRIAQGRAATHSNFINQSSAAKQKLSQIFPRVRAELMQG